jgi:hypothetical protein
MHTLGLLLIYGLFNQAADKVKGKVVPVLK